MPAPQLHKLSQLRALVPRRDPYWGAPVARGRHVGYRKLDGERGSWIARFRGEDKKMRFRALGAATPTFQFDEAKAAALEWFAAQENIAIDTKRDYSVADACNDYVLAKHAAYEAEVRQSGPIAKSSQPAWLDAQNRFKRTVVGKAFGAKVLAKLNTSEIKKWRESLGLSQASQNRTMTVVRAAFNLAVENRRVPASRAIEWDNVKQHQYVSESKVPYLDLDQRRAFLASSGKGDFHDFVLAHILTGARPGELAKMRASQFDVRAGTAKFIGKISKKVGPRIVPLSDDALTLFKSRSAGLKPDDLLFTNRTRPWIHYEWDVLVRASANAAQSPEGTVLYAFRHSWITETLMVGRMTTLEVARLAGTSLAMIEKHYGHLVRSQALSRLNAVKFV